LYARFIVDGVLRTDGRPDERGVTRAMTPVGVDVHGGF